MPFREPFKPKFKAPLGGFDLEVDVTPKGLSKPPPSPIPDHNPFRVGLERNPVPSASDVEAGQIIGDVLESGKKLGGIGIEVAADEAKEKVVTAVVGRTVATAVGVIATPFILADVMEIAAPGVKSWLTGGWKGASGRGRTLDPAEVFRNQGGATGFYRLVYSATYYSSGSGQTSLFSSSSSDVPGPLTIVRLPTEGLRTTTDPSEGFFFMGVGDTQARGVAFPWGIVPGTLVVTITKNATPAGPDAPVYAPRKPGVVVTNPKPSNSSWVPAPSPPPLSQNLPSTKALKDLFESVEDSIAPFRDLLPPTESSPANSTEPESISSPAPITYSPPPKNPEPTLEEDDTCNPCLLKIGKKLDEISEKLDEKEEDDEETEEPNCETYPFEYSHGICDSDGFTLEPRVLQLAQKPTAQLRAEFDNMLALAAKGCGCDAVAAIPDWWQVRIGADRPQIVVAFRKADSRTYHQISIPHPEGTQKWTENLLGDYTKGPWSGVLTLKDNSKFIINCETLAEAQRMVAKAKALIKPAMQFSPSVEQYAERKGNSVGVALMRGRQAYFFSKGQRDAKPDWRAQFD